MGNKKLLKWLIWFNLTIDIVCAPVKKQENKFDAFSATSIADWERAAKEELQGADPWKKLNREQNGVSIKPFYVQGSADTAVQLSPSRNEFIGPRAWYNCPRIVVTNANEANILALNHLKHGADGIFFEMDEAVDFTMLLKSIEWEFCSLNFLAKNDSKEIASSLTQFLGKTKGPTHGALFANHTAIPPIHGSFRFIGYNISSGETVAGELAQGIISVEKLLGKKFAEFAPHVAFSTTIGNDFFLETAKLRALRGVWLKLLKKKGADPTTLFIHAWSPSWLNESYAPHGNMLKSTSASMAAILGGCDALTIEPEDSSSAMMARAARNVSNVLREESRFSKVADPLAGSYFIEDLTLQLINQAWNMIESNTTS